MENETESKKLSNRRTWLLIGIHITVAIALSGALLYLLDQTQDRFAPAEAMREIKASVPDTVAVAPDSMAESQARPTTGAGVTVMNRSNGVTFLEVLLLMLLAGGLGGILCNFRGLFVHLRDEMYFPVELEIPYYVRGFTGAICGLIIYFVASLLVVSITLEAVASNITFQGMISYIALALLAGFASQEFTERLKQTAGTLFGQRAQKDKAEKLRELHALKSEGVLTEEEFLAEKKKLLESNYR